MLPRRIDLDDTEPDRGRPLAERYEEFAGHFVRTRNAAQAFRIAFAPDRSVGLSIIHAQADRLLRDESMQARMRELIDAATRGTLMTVQSLLTDLHDIATADPNELISHVVECCRHCHGEGFGFQWVDESEWARACDDVAKRNAKLPPGAPHTTHEPLPEIAGGFGYWPTNDPNPCCPHCFGRGVGRTVLHDTTKLSPAARKLYKGVKETRNGIEVLMHDQYAAHDLLLRVAGALKETVPLTPPPADQADRDAIPAEATEAEVGRAYLGLISGGKG
jgi:phage terminase small subunit